MSYIKDTRAEMRHVAWPTQRQTVTYTALVVLVSALVALYIGVFDFAFTKGLEWIVTSGVSPVQTVSTNLDQGAPEGLTVEQSAVSASSTPIQFNITPETAPQQ